SSGYNTPISTIQQPQPTSNPDEDRPVNPFSESHLAPAGRHLEYSYLTNFFIKRYLLT
ncbi:hypothetical protein J6590_082883, partial [Homalodisca vitripennis]